MRLIEKLDTISELKKEGTAVVPLDAYKGIYTGEVTESDIKDLQTLSVALEKDASFFEGLKGAIPDKRTMGMMAGSALLAPVLAAGGRGVAKGVSNIHDKLTFNRDLQNIAELNPNLDPEDKYTQMAYKSMRTLNPIYAKDPLIANTLLTNIMREKDKHGVPMMMPQRTKDMVDSYSRMRTPDYFAEDMGRSFGALPGQMLESRLEQDKYDRQIADRRQDYKTQRDDRRTDYKTQRDDRREDYGTQRDDRREDMKTQEGLRRNTFQMQREPKIEDAIRTEYGRQTGEILPQGMESVNIPVDFDTTMKDKFDQLMQDRSSQDENREISSQMIRSGLRPTGDQAADLRQIRQDIDHKMERPVGFDMSPYDTAADQERAKLDERASRTTEPMQEGELSRFMQEQLLRGGSSVPTTGTEIRQAYDKLVAQRQNRQQGNQQSQGPQKGQSGTTGQFTPPTT